ncbi:MAG: cytochrome b/b6 domain-containing protein, partial [Coriobacteriia bacterium]|nr:cytochrome b/b6 domain-containing protein [Coriobacteriia bacterium]
MSAIGQVTFMVNFNVWLDVVFTALYVVVLLGLAGHFFGNILTGRARRRFGKKWEWPHHEGPEIPFLPKFLHFTHVFSMIMLAISGLYVRFPGFIPLWDGARTSMRYVHYVFMIIVTINLVWRLWYAFFSARRDYKEFAITRQDVVTAPKVILYYIFVKPSKPHLAKYNVMQKMTYTLFAPLLILQAFTGFALLDELQFFGTNLQEVLIGWNLGVIVASTSYAGWIMRTTH